MPKRRIDAEEIDRTGLQELMDRGARIGEVPPQAEFDFAHLPRAIKIPIKSFGADLVDRSERDRPVVVYCNKTE